jgi:bacillithiol biosynthesis deacetylase BshB1
MIESVSTDPRPCDIVAFVAHPDDAELNCGGTLALSARQGRRVGIVDFTRGELSTRGTPELRAEESAAAARELGLECRVNLGFADGHLRDDEQSRRAVVELLRTMKPSIVIAPPFEDHHPDHMAVATIISRSVYLAGVAKYAPGLAPFRPDSVLHYVGNRPIAPQIIVDISSVHDARVAAIRCFRSQFFDAESKEGTTRIALPEFMDWVDGRLRHFGMLIGASRGEGFTSAEPVPITDLASVFGRGRWENRSDKS